MISDRPVDLAGLSVRPGATALMVWDVDFPSPDPALVHQLLQGPCHVWHGGLLLGQADRPAAWNLCHGRAMFSRDGDPSVESTSWKMSLKAVIIRNEVMVALGGFDPAFDTAAGTALDAGLRWIRRGALMRHVPGLVPAAPAADAEPPPTEVDGIRIVQRHLGARWAFARGVRKGLIGLRAAPAALRALREPHLPSSAVAGLPVPEPAAGAAVDLSARVTVLVPTVGRYPFLGQLLLQLDGQSRRPDEVVVVDQNDEASRRDLAAIAPELPLKVLYLLPPGQCTARNLGLRASTGTHILFLDDDDEIPVDCPSRTSVSWPRPRSRSAAALSMIANRGPRLRPSATARPRASCRPTTPWSAGVCCTAPACSIPPTTVGRGPITISGYVHTSRGTSTCTIPDRRCITTMRRKGVCAPTALVCERGGTPGRR